MGIIYKHTSRTSGKSYIGKTVGSLISRLSGHIHAAFRQKSNLRFHKALRKYGKEDFISTVLENDIPDSELNTRERYWIAFYNTQKKGYNMSEGGEGLKPNTLIVVDQRTGEVSQVTKEEWQSNAFYVALSKGRVSKRVFCSHCSTMIPTTGKIYHFDFCYKNPQRKSLEKICLYCSKVCRTPTGYGNHILRCKKNPNSTARLEIKCQYCQKVYGDGGNLKQHELSCLVNVNKVSYNCTFCTRAFLKKSSQRKHELYDCKLNPSKVIREYLCNFCSKKFNAKLNCQSHERYRCDLNPSRILRSYDCIVCEKHFTDPGNYKKHQVSCSKTIISNLSS